MGIRNYLIEGVSGTGKTSVCHELRRRGYHSINGDTELAYQGDPVPGQPVSGFTHEHHIWNMDQLRTLTTDRSNAASFFCGGSRNWHTFIDVFDRIFVLEIDLDTLNKRLAERPDTEWGGKPAEREFIRQLHATKEEFPNGGIIIDATAPLATVVDEILEKCT
ncbi:MAG: AAA family ATPase [Roseibium sp.]